MNRQKIGMMLFWIGVISIIVMQGLTWSHASILRVNTAEELRGTVYAVDGVIGFLRYQVAGGLGMVLPIVGALLFTSKKGSYLWLLGGPRPYHERHGNDVDSIPTHTAAFWPRRDGYPSIILWHIMDLDPNLYCI